MKLALPLALFGFAAIAAPRDAHAFAACYSNKGYAPAPATKLPPHPRVLAYADDDYGNPPKFSATIDGKSVPVKVAIVKSAPYVLRILEIDSSKTGKLEIKGDRGTVTYTIAKDASLPKEVPVIVGRSQRAFQHTTVHEVFDALAIRLPEGTPAITAHLKIRRDANASWSELDVPVTPSDFEDGRPLIRVGELGCTKNYGLDLLKQGVDIEATLTLVDGSTRPAKDLASHITLPPPLPANPKPKQP